MIFDLSLLSNFIILPTGVSISLILALPYFESLPESRKSEPPPENFPIYIHHKYWLVKFMSCACYVATDKNILYYINNFQNVPIVFHDPFRCFYIETEEIARLW